MKRTIVLLLILIVLAGVIFGVGYAPLRLRGTTALIMHSRTSGWDPNPITAGAFRWSWQLLIPGNVTLHEFDTSPQTFRFDQTIALPSSDLYRTFLEGEPSLQYRLEGKITVRTTADYYLRRVDDGYDPTQEEALVDAIEAEIVRDALDAMVGALADIPPEVVGTELIRAATSAAEGRLATRYPEIEIVSVLLTRVERPDPALYEAGRLAWRDIQRAQTAGRAESAATIAREQALEAARIARLERYGQLLDAYPVLLEYLQIAAETGADPLSAVSTGGDGIAIPDLE